jgi:hypothetical protein
VSHPKKTENNFKKKKVRNVCLFTLVGIIGRARGFLLRLFFYCIVLEKHPLNDSCCSFNSSTRRIKEDRGRRRRIFEKKSFER